MSFRSLYSVKVLTANYFEKHPTLQKILANSGWLFLDKVFRMGVGVVVGAWIARYLGPEQYGIYNYSVAFVSLFTVFATLGLDGIVVRNLVRDCKDRNEVLGTTFVLKLIGSTIAILLSILAICFVKSDKIFLMLVGIISLGTFFQAFDTIDFWFQSQVQSKYSVYAKNFAFFIVSIIKVLLIILHAPLVGFAIAGLIETVLGAIGLAMAYKNKKLKISSWSVSATMAKNLLKDSWPLIISAMVIMVYMRIDQIMLGQMKGDKEVGIYTAALRLSEVWYFVPTVIVNSVFPSIVNAKSVDNLLYITRLQQLFNVVAIMSISIAFPISAASYWFIKVLFGANYLEAGLVLAIHIWTGVFVALGIARGPWSITEGYMKFGFATTVLGAIVNVVLNLFLIPKYGALGAAIATVCAQFLAAYFANVFYSTTREIFIMQTRALLMIDAFKKLYSFSLSVK